jgi:phosphate acetyltransferase
MASMSDFLAGIQERAREGGPKRILLPEGGDQRVLEAALRLKKSGLAEPIMVHEKGADVSHMEAGGLARVEVDEHVAEELERLLLSLRSHKVGTADELLPERARELSRDPLVYGMYLLRTKKADALVAGAERTTADVVRSALWLVGTAPGIKTVSSSFYMVIPPAAEGEKEKILTFADCGIVEHPTAVQLADIAIAAADARSFVVGDEPRIAFLSYSTKGSGGKKESVTRVQEAIKIAKEKRPDLLISDHELQVDAALVQSVAERKAPGDRIAGDANVLVFPDLNSGNISYKLVERLVPGAHAIGPVLQGLPSDAVVHDVSRGATADDIERSALIAALRAQNR